MVYHPSRLNQDLTLRSPIGQSRSLCASHQSYLTLWRQSALDHESTLERVKCNIRDGRSIAERDLDILNQGDIESFNTIIDKMTAVGITIDPKYKRKDGGKGKRKLTPAQPKPTPKSTKKRKTTKDDKADEEESESEDSDSNDHVEWTERQDPRFVIQTKKHVIIQSQAMDSKVAIGVNKNDPEPQRIIVAQFLDSGSLLTEAVNISCEGNQFKAKSGLAKYKHYVPLEYEIQILIDLIEFREEINSTVTGLLMHHIRTYVWDELIERGKDPTSNEITEVLATG